MKHAVSLKGIKTLPLQGVDASFGLKGAYLHVFGNTSSGV